jgi:hypothetical protein
MTIRIKTYSNSPDLLRQFAIDWVFLCLKCQDIARGMAAEILCGTMWNKDYSTQPDLKFCTNSVVSQNAVNEGRAQKNKNTIFVPNLIKNQ